VGSVNRFFSRKSAFSAIQGLANQKRVCDFLLVLHSNLGPILHHFGDIAGFVLLTPPYSTLILGCSRCTKSPMFGVNLSRYKPQANQPWNYFRSIPTCV